jgi:DNA-binding response OmpR family regulator
MHTNRPEILIIDDNELIRENLRIALESEGYAVSQARNGKNVLKLIEKYHPSIIITDVLMPECDGLEVLRNLRDHRERPKVIAISGGGLLPGERCLSLAGSFGADAVLAKPFRPGQLIAMIEDLIAA